VKLGRLALAAFCLTVTATDAIGYFKASQFYETAHVRPLPQQHAMRFGVVPEN